jgi:hypothetical protein
MHAGILTETFPPERFDGIDRFTGTIDRRSNITIIPHLHDYRNAKMRILTRLPADDVSLLIYVDRIQVSRGNWHRGAYNNTHGYQDAKPYCGTTPMCFLSCFQTSDARGLSS